MYKGSMVFGSDIIPIEKTIYVVLDGDESHIDCASSIYHANNIKELFNAIRNDVPEIITPLTCIISSEVMRKGYNIIVHSNGCYIDFYNIVNGDTSKTYAREIRITHNWETMLYNGCFDIKVEWEENRK